MRRLACMLALLCVAALGSSCSVSGVLNSTEIIEELDEIVRIEGTGEDRRITYAERANVSRWFMRWSLLAPIRGMLAWSLGRRQVVDLENPSNHVRELVRELPPKLDRNLLSCGNAASRFGWLAELDNNAETRLLAIDGLADVCGLLALRPFDGPFDQLGLPPDADELAMAQAGIQVGRPELRSATTWSDANLEPYREALADIVARPLSDWSARLLLIEDLTALYAAENDERARPWVENALRQAITHCVRGILLRTIQGRERQLAEVRLCAMEQIRRLGGARTVPLMLAAMAASPAERARGESQYDSDALVQLRLIHYCGQLGADDRDSIVQLPGRQDWEATSPVEYLARTVLSEREYYSKLRTPALVALTWCLGRPDVDPNPAWVRDWLESRRL